MPRLTLFAIAGAVVLAGCKTETIELASSGEGALSEPPTAQGVTNVAFQRSDKRIRGEFQISFDKDGKPDFKDPGMLALLSGAV